MLPLVHCSTHIPAWRWENWDARFSNSAPRNRPDPISGEVKTAKMAIWWNRHKCFIYFRLDQAYCMYFPFSDLVRSDLCNIPVFHNWANVSDPGDRLLFFSRNLFQLRQRLSTEQCSSHHWFSDHDLISMQIHWLLAIRLTVWTEIKMGWRPLKILS